MRKTIPMIIAIVSGLVVLAGFFLMPTFNPILRMILQWGVIVGSMAGITGIVSLLASHFKRLRFKEKRAGFSVVILLAFAASFIAALVLGVDNPLFTRWLSAIQLPIETSLLALIALTLTYAGVHFFSLRGWTSLSISFGISAIIFLLVGIGFISTIENPALVQIMNLIRSIPLAGSRGILIGMALGGLLVGLRILFGVKRPYGE